MKPPIELCPWQFMDDGFLGRFLIDPRNNENAPDRKIVIDYLTKNAIERDLLDVGSGTGNMYLALKKAGEYFGYLGVDKTRKMIDFARKRFPEAHFIEGDVYELPLDNSSWPVVYIRHVFAHLSGYEKALAEVARVCSDCLAICLLKPLGDREQIKIVGKPFSQVGAGRFSEHYLNQYAREPFIAQLKDGGFTVDMDKRVDIGGYFQEYELIIARRRE